MIRACYQLCNHTKFTKTRLPDLKKMASRPLTYERVKNADDILSLKCCWACLFYLTRPNDKGADMTQNIFQDIKDRVDLKDLVRYYGLDVDRGGFACCPFHNERNPSFKVYEDHYHCFGCGAHGDHTELVQIHYVVSNIEAARYNYQDLGI